MPKNRKGMHKEWHSKRIDYRFDVALEFLEFLNQAYDLKDAFGLEVEQAYLQLVDALYKNRGSLEVEEYCGQYLVEYGYNWVPDTDAPTA